MRSPSTFWQSCFESFDFDALAQHCVCNAQAGASPSKDWWPMMIKESGHKMLMLTASPSHSVTTYATTTKSTVKFITFHPVEPEANQIVCVELSWAFFFDNYHFGQLSRNSQISLISKIQCFLSGGWLSNDLKTVENRFATDSAKAAGFEVLNLKQLHMLPL